ncbi:MAG: hypothetical protein L7S56_02005 [Candidatus Poseidonia sp.]|nr:hypothetical protein [Poseidonia sp.]
MRSLRWSLVLALLLLSLTSTALADGDDGDDDDDDEQKVLGIDGEDLGDVALYLLIATLLIVIWKPVFKWLRKNGPELFDKEPRKFKRKLGVFNRRFMKVHNWIGLGTAVVGTIHGYVLEWHWTLWAGMGALWILVFSGSMMQWRWPPKEFRKGARLLHLQRTLSLVALILLYVGHGIVD